MDQELTHHGIRGQKWGRRRYQNPDGSLTPAGRKRYGVESNYERSKGEHNKPNKPAKVFGKKKSPDDDIPEENRYLSKKARSMTDKELDKAIERLQKEQRLKQISPEEIDRAKKLMDDQSYRKKSLKDMSDEEIVKALNRANLERQYKQAYPEHVSAGKKFMQSLTNDVIAPAAKSAGRDFLEKALKKMGENLLKDKVDPDGIDALKKAKEKLGLKKDIKDLQDELTGKKKDDDKRTDLEKERDEWKTKSELKKYKDEYEGKKKSDEGESAKQMKERITAEDWLYDNDPDWRAANPERANAAKIRKAEAAAKAAKETADKAAKEVADKAAKEAPAKAKSFVDSIIKQTSEQFLLPEGDSKANKAWNKSQKKAEKEETSRVNKMKDDLKSKLNQMKEDTIKVGRDDYDILDPEPRSKSSDNSSKKSTNDTVIETTYVDKSYVPIVYSPSTSATARSGQSFTNQWGQYLLPPWKDEDD